MKWDQPLKYLTPQGYENNLPLENTEFEIEEGYQITSAKLIKDDRIKKSKISFDEIFTQSSNVEV